MATSLAAQLKRLATPQTSILVEKKKYASILFDSKEASTKNRKTIYDIGIQGLEELITLNPIFQEFKYTLFDESTIEFERAVETSSVNKTLDKNIKKFLLQLSPYFSRQPAYKCLEWLIRRYGINEHNVEDMMALILPYHETQIFVKCVEIMRLGEYWHWIQPNQNAGVPIAKQTIIIKAARDPFFLQFISNTIKAAVEELNTKAYTLQALFAFYTTITLGALDVVNEITNSHVSNIASTLLAGLSSNVVDFCASAIIITGFLVTKVTVSKLFLNKVIEKLAKICHRELKRESLVALIIIYQTQNKNIEIVNETLLTKMINDSSLVTLLGSLYDKHINVLSLCLPLITACLRNVENKKKPKRNQKFVEMLLSELSLNTEDAEAVIMCILNALKRMSGREPVETVSSTGTSDDDVIELNTDDENDGDVCMVDDNSQWYSSLLRNLETRYPDVFDAVKRDIMSNQDEDSSSQQKSLKTILGSLLCTAYNADPSGATIFVDLYHPSAVNRIQAVKMLVDKLSTMPFSDDKKNLLVTGIVERLSDSNPLVVTEVLKFKTEDLIKIVGEQNLIRKLKLIIGDAFMMKKKWQDAVNLAIKHITSKQLLSDSNEIEIFLAIWPYMFPVTNSMVNITKKVLQSDIVDRFSIIKRIQKFKFKDTNNDLPEFNQFLHKQLENFLGMSKTNEIVQFVKTIPDAEMTKTLAFHIIKLLTHSLANNCDHKLATEVLEIVSRFSVQFKTKYSAIDDNIQLIYNMNVLPIQVIVKCIQSIIEKTNFSTFVKSKDIDFTCKNNELCLIIKIYENLCTGLYAKSRRTNGLFNKVILDFLRIILPNLDKQLEFFSNFFINHYIHQLSDTPNCIFIEPTLQLRSMRLFNTLLKEVDGLAEMTTEVFIRIISGLTSPFEAVRTITCDTIQMLHDLLNQSSQFSKIFGGLLKDRERFLLNPNELSLSLFHIKCQRTHLFEFIRRPESAMILKASALNMLGLIKSIKYLEIVIDAAMEIFNRIDSAQRIILNPHESIVVNETIIRYNLEAIQLISSNGKCRNFFEKSLKQNNVFLHINNKLHSISVLVMNLIISNNFNDLPNNQKIFFIDSIVKSATFSENEEVRAKVNLFFRKSVQLDGKIELDILTQMAKVTTTEVIPKNEMQECFSPEFLPTPEWKCGVTLLEFLQKNRLKNPAYLMRQLFPILEKCLKFDEQSMVEYTKQLVLGNILNCCELLSPAEAIPEGYFKIELIVECIRGTHNPQTHHHALLLLTKLATMMPETVLHNMVDIFTFVGTSVVRRDDTYIYQLISNIIKSVVPILKENHIIQVLKAFSDAILDVAVHRRSTLYEDLLNTLDPVKSIWMFLAILFEKDLRHSKADLSLKRTHIAIEITNLFDCDIIIETCSALITFSRSQLNQKRTKDNTIDRNFSGIFDVKHYTDNECTVYRNRIFHFINVLTSETSEFSTKMTSLGQESLIKLKENFKNIIPAILDYIKASANDQNVPNTGKVIDDSFTACYHILDHLLDLLYPDMLIQVVDALLSEQNEAEVRLKIVDLLNKKLDTPELFADCNNSILSLLGPLTNIVKSITNSEKQMKNVSEKQNATLQKDALVAIQLLSRILASTHPIEFGSLLKVLSKILESYQELSIVMRVCVIECLGEVCGNLRVDAISYLHRFMPLITDVLNHLPMETNPACFEIILKAVHRIVETLPLFLHPYLSKLIASLCILWSRLQSISTNASQKSLLKLNDIWQKLASSLELRVLIPLIEKNIYPNLLDQKNFNGVGPLMVLLMDSFEHVTTADLVQNCSELTSFFIGVMDFRTKFHQECDTVDVQENFFIKAFVALILKMYEASFRPLYSKVHQWSIENVGLSFDRAVTFYRLSSKIAESLKSLFKPFAANIIQNSADLLKKNFTNKEIKASSTRPVVLIYNILETMNSVFLHSNRFLNQDRFNILMEPLVNLLDNQTYLADENIVEILPKCLAQFAVAANDDVLWKQLIHQVLMKTKNDSVVIRRCALICGVEIIVQLGEDSTLLQDIILYFSELLEDDDPEIVALCQKSILQIEKVVNEPLQKYF